MKKIYFFFLLVIPFLSIAQISGEKTVGGVSSNYQTIQEAIDSLASNGINGAVTIKIEQGIYNENIIMPVITGVSAQNTITFESATLNALSVNIVGDLTSTFAGYCDFVKYRYITVSSNGNQSPSLFHFEDVSQITFENCILDQASSISVGINIFSNLKSCTNFSISNTSIIADKSIFVTGNHFKNFSIIGGEFQNSNEFIDLQLDSLVENITVYGAQVLNCNKAVNISGDTKGVKNIQVLNSSFHFISEGIHLSSNEKLENVVVENCEIIGYYPSTTGGLGMGIFIQAVEDVKNLEIKNSKVDSVENSALYVDLTKDLDNAVIKNNFLNGENNGVQINGVNSVIQNIHFSYNTITSFQDYAVKILNDKLIHDIDFNGDSILFSNGGIKILSNISAINNLSLDSVIVENKVIPLCCNHAFWLETAQSEINNLSISNSYFEGYNGVSINSIAGMHNVILENDSIDSPGKALEILNENNIIENLTLNDVYAKSNVGEGIGLESEFSNLEDIEFNNVVAIGDDGVKMNAFLGAFNLKIDSCEFYGISNCGINYNGQYGGAKNWIIESSEIFGEEKGVSIIQNSHNIDNVSIIGNEIVNSSLNQSGIGLYIYSEYSKLINCEIANNEIEGSSYGIYFMGNTLGMFNDSIIGNKIRMTSSNTSGSGFYAEKVGEGNYFLQNKIEIDDQGSGFSYGFYLSGDEMQVNQLTLLKNEVINARDIAFDIENVSGLLKMEENKIWNELENGNMEGLFLYQVDSVKFERNEFYSVNENVGLDFMDLNYGRLYNNFISGFNQNLKCDNCQKQVFAHNTFNTNTQNSASDLIVFSGNCSNNQFLNNIINTDSLTFSGNIYSLITQTDLSVCINNVYNFDTLQANLVHLDNGNLYPSILNWKNYANKENNSFYYSPSFINNTTDLHVLCTDVALNNGSILVGLPKDIDLNPRAEIPTIGADEMLHSWTIIALDSIVTCDLPIQISLEGEIEGSIYWSNQTTQPQTTITEFGTYYVQIYSDCGFIQDSIRILECEIIDTTDTTDGLFELKYNYKVYPNPVTSELTIKGENGFDKIIIQNLQGQNIKEYQYEQTIIEQTISLEFLEKGMYNLIFYRENKFQNHRIVKN